SIVKVFALRVEDALHDQKLQTALTRATGQLGARRTNAFASLENADAVRDRAREARMRAIRDLADHLERFEANLTKNGAHVHWAQTARDANAIVAGIAMRTKTRRVVKSKSMVSEETHLNDALQKHGIDVVETDLGEYIVQLANDRPSHIIAPIIHMTRQDVGRVMQERLRVPYTDDPKALAATARARLRVEFLRADMGISGANFGVADTGTIVLVTNEGNGRMVTTLPRVHVVLMGIEKLVASLDDLDQCLKVLARSGTGQKLTVYTTMIRGPRKTGDADGPAELHVVLLDNARSTMLAGESAEILGCIRCGACLNVCPVYRSIGGHAYGDTYGGPVGAIVTPGLRGLDAWSELPHASSLCAACRDVCPVRLDIPRMLLSLRYQAVKQTKPSGSLALAMKSFAWAASKPRVYRALAKRTRGWLRMLARDGWISKLPGPAGRWTLSRDLKAPAAQTFQDQWRALKK
ncbi:MAG TPA: LutB/LldF family L-lactate oxidation iron-sulfur protein, partial [Vicinamibacterales bacterium]|nr:LutB/LldF family L-lactate oxidation iron-sulfur protein [Vicinamibacterales bacterium]